MFLGAAERMGSGGASFSEKSAASSSTPRLGRTSPALHVPQSSAMINFLYQDLSSRDLPCPFPSLHSSFFHVLPFFVILPHVSQVLRYLPGDFSEACDACVTQYVELARV